MAYLQELQDVQDGLNFIHEYQKNPEVREVVNSSGVYKNDRYFWEFISSVNSFSPSFSKYYRDQVSRKALTRQTYQRQDPNALGVKLANYVNYCLRSPNEMQRVWLKAVDFYGRTYNLSADQISNLKQGYTGPNAIKKIIVDEKKKAEEKKKKEAQEKAKKEAEEKAKKLADQQVKGELASYKETTGKEVKMAEKTHLPSEDEAKQKLDQLLGVQPESPRVLVDALGRPLMRDKEIIQATPETPTAGQSNLPIEQIRQAESWVNQGRQILRPVSEDALSQGKVIITRGKPAASRFAQNMISSLRGTGSNTRSAASGLRTAGSLARGARGLFSSAKALSMAARLIPLLGPWGLVLIVGLPLLLVGAMLFLMLFKAGADCPPYQGCQTANTSSLPPSTNLLTLSKTGTDRVSGVGQDITYTIAVTYTGTGTASAEVNDRVPEGTQFKESGNGRNENGVVRWSLNNLQPNQAQNLSFIVTTTRDGPFWAVNKADANYTITPPTGGGTVPNPQPNQENCAGRSDFFPRGYRLRAPLYNFGDPECNMTRDGLIAAIRAEDPVYWDYVFGVLIPCESVPAYNPNSHSTWAELGSHPNTDRDGVWGLFSMGRGKNGTAPRDRGDVVWQNQVTNAIFYKNLSRNRANPFWDYWECARRNPPPIR